MIRYPIKVSEIRRLIRDTSGSWFRRANERTETFRRAQEYHESSNIWGEIKSVYMQIQHNKCAYCERQLEDPKHGKIEHDIEHYRPKDSVDVWPSERIIDERRLNYDFDTGDGWTEGYYLLAYNNLNYATACKVCNSTLKSNYFPIEGNRGPQSDNPRELRSEKPYLIYPVSNIDTDPERLITFEGIIAIPKGRSGHRFRRGRVTIDFFDLNGRGNIRKQRAAIIRTLSMAFQVLDSVALDQADKTIARETIKICTLSSSEHCNCARAYCKMHERNPEKARAIAREALFVA